MFLSISSFHLYIYIFYISDCIILNLIILIFFKLTEYSRISTNLVYTLYRMQSIGTMSLTSLKKQLDPKNYKQYEEKSVETWFSLTRPVFLDYMYNVSSSNFSYYVLHVYSSSFYIISICIHKFWIFFIVQQEYAEANNIAFNHYNETHHVERTSEGVSETISAIVNKKREISSSGFTKQLAIANINLTHVFFEEVRHHWGSFLCMKCYKRNFIVLLSILWMQKSKSDGSNFEMRIGWTKMYYISRNLPSLILHLMIGYQSLRIGYTWKIYLLRSFIIFFHLLFNCHQMCLLSPSISKFGSLRLSIQYSTVNSKAGR